MPDNPVQDRNVGLSRHRQGGRWVTKYDPDLAARIVEAIAGGELLREVCQEDRGFPAPTTFMRWVVQYPELSKAYNAAVMLSARMFEEEAIAEAREARKTPGTQNELRSVQMLIDQLRWSSERRDPARFGAARTASVVVPIQINTTLDLGGADSTKSIPDIYTVNAKVEKEVEEAPDKPRLLSPPTYDRTAPRKRVLTPRVPMDTDLHKETDDVGG